MIYRQNFAIYLPQVPIFSTPVSLFDKSVEEELLKKGFGGLMKLWRILTSQTTFRPLNHYPNSSSLHHRILRFGTRR